LPKSVLPTPVRPMSPSLITLTRLIQLRITSCPPQIQVGEAYWNRLTSDLGSADTGKFIRAAELKHGRSAMVATVGFAFHKLGLTLDHISPHEYLSVTEGVK